MNPEGAEDPQGGLDIQRILKALPHRWPFVLVDRVAEMVRGERIRGHKCVTMGEPWFQGHFPGRPVMPGVLVVEALAQLAGVLAHASEPGDSPGGLVYLLGIDRARFRRVVVPGDRLDLSVSVEHRRGSVWKFHGEASVDGEPCASADLLAGLVDPPR